jgi:hypothetical protein
MIPLEDKEGVEGSDAVEHLYYKSGYGLEAFLTVWWH